MENNLEEIANKIRINTVKEVYYAQSGHPGGSLSIADILAVLYFKEMKIDPKNPKDENRDRFVLSKGHCSPALYATLALKGFFSMDELKNFRNINSILQGHPDMKKIPGVDMSTGSLGQGLSAANGMAIAGKLDNKDYRVYAILGDGEIDEDELLLAKYGELRLIVDSFLKKRTGNELKYTVLALNYLVGILACPHLKEENKEDFLEAVCNILDEMEQLKFQSSIILNYGKKEYRHFLKYRNMTEKRIFNIEQQVRAMNTVYLKQYKIDGEIIL